VGKEGRSNISPDEYLDLFEKAMKKLAIAVDKEMSEPRYLIYFEHLSSYSIEDIQYAVNRAIHEEKFSVIPPVGKLIKFIEELKMERREWWPKLEYHETWPDTPPERVRELIQPFYDKLAKQEKALSEAEREEAWKRNKEKLLKQADLVKQNADPGEQE
jgi:hypothetical protein